MAKIDTSLEPDRLIRASQEAVGDFMSNLNEQTERLQETAQHAWGRTREYVVTHPGRTLLASAAVGFVLGGLLFRRR